MHNMEESNEVQHEEDKALPEKNSKRRFKTPSQLQALEDFYNEHKYPTESMKAELAENLGLSDKQVSGWFCHRRLKDKRRDEAISLGRQGHSSSVIQDRGSGLKQDSCSSSKQGDNRVTEPREVESRRFCQDDNPLGEMNYEPMRLYDGVEVDVTSSLSNSAEEESFYPMDVETTLYRAPPRFGGASGYLKIKGRMENAAITAVKRQLGTHYQENGPPLGIDFDPLPPEAFESPSKIIDNDAYRVEEPLASRCANISGIHKRPGHVSIRDHEMFAEAAQHKPSDNIDHDNFLDSQHEKKHYLPTNGVIPVQKSSNGVGSFLYNHSQAYRGKQNTEEEEPWSPGFDDLNRWVVCKSELDSAPGASLCGPEVPVGVEDGLLSIKDEPCMERRPMTDHHDSIRFKTCPIKDPKAGKRRRDGFLQQDYAVRASSREASQWSKLIKGSHYFQFISFNQTNTRCSSNVARSSTMEIPSSFSEDETGETSSSMD